MMKFGPRLGRFASDVFRARGSLFALALVGSVTVACTQVVEKEVFIERSNAALDSCGYPVCGDGQVDPGEQCDDWNTNSGDGCSSSCQYEQSSPVCGNWTVESGEQCDDGNTNSGDGCSSSCQYEQSSPVCGNWTVESGEQCDDGNATDGDGCSSSCQSEYCGNGRVESSEGCDDGNTNDGDGCSSSCQVEHDCPSDACHLNGRWDSAGQQCTSDAVDCSQNVPTCMVWNGSCDPSSGCGYQHNDMDPSCNAVCGNGTVDSGEQCDDGNTSSGDGCASDCNTESDPCYGIDLSSDPNNCGACFNACIYGQRCKQGKCQSPCIFTNEANYCGGFCDGEDEVCMLSHPLDGSGDKCECIYINHNPPPWH